MAPWFVTVPVAEGTARCNRRLRHSDEGNQRPPGQRSPHLTKVEYRMYRNSFGSFAAERLRMSLL